MAEMEPEPEVGSVEEGILPSLQLPDEVMRIIGGFLDPVPCAQFYAVCRQTRDILRERHLQLCKYAKVWQKYRIKPLTLTELNLRLNQIQDVTPLAGLTALTRLDLRNNQIQDTDPVVVALKKRGVHIWV